MTLGADKRSLKVGICQVKLQSVSTVEQKLIAIERISKLIVQSPPADIFVLPELAPIGYSEECFQALADLAEDELGPPTEAPCREAFARVARQHSAFICYGIPARRPDGKFAIRQVVLDDSGCVVTSYDKCHLCDYGDCAETRFFEPGVSLSFFECRGWRVGLMICADIRYSELCRELVVGRGCDIILQPAAFARDVSYASWQSFVECRSLENQIYWAGVNYAGDHFGGSMWCPPWIDGDQALTERLGVEEEVRTFEASRIKLDLARRDFGFLRLRKNREEYAEPRCYTARASL